MPLGFPATPRSLSLSAYARKGIVTIDYHEEVRERALT